MKILIPMSGLGKRFLQAGYSLPKPLLTVDRMPMIEHVTRNFSPDDNIVFGVNEEHLKTTDLQSVLRKIAPHSKIVSMPYQAKGPVAVVTRLFEHLRDEEEAIVNYSDFSWVWNYNDFKREMARANCDGAIICYRGFHPHLLGPNKYATLDANGLWMKEIREKYSWHDNKMKDWSSSGTYYFKKGRYIKKYFQEILKRPEWIIRGEYYVSQIYQLMQEDGFKIRIYEIPFMLQWGTPEDLEQYLWWSDFFRKECSSEHKKTTSPMTVLILMAGAGKRFSEEGYTEPKPFISVDHLPMAVRSAQSLPQGNQYVFVIRDSVTHQAGEAILLKTCSPATFVRLDKITEGQACTALEAIHNMDLEKPLLIGACDHGLQFDDRRFLELGPHNPSVDALIFTFRNNPRVHRNPEMYGWVQTSPSEPSLATNISVKEPLEGDPAKNHAIVGAFWFRKARYFTENASRMIRENNRIRNEFYIDQCMNHLIRSHLIVHVFEVDKYVSWGTPDDLRTYQYWQKFFHQAPFHPYQLEGT